mgnify:CR=1 FL=1
MFSAGATFVEMTTESYFFKKMKDADADMIGVFRMTRPFSYIVGPLIGIPIFYLFPNGGAFFFLAAIMFSGLFFVFRITDTR